MVWYAFSLCMFYLPVVPDQFFHMMSGTMQGYHEQTVLRGAACNARQCSDFGIAEFASRHGCRDFGQALQCMRTRNGLGWSEIIPLKYSSLDRSAAASKNPNCCTRLP